MKRIQLDNRTKIQLLKATNIVSVTALVVSNIAGKVVLDAYEKQQKRLKLASRIVERFAELAPPDVCEQIMQEFEFEWITHNLDMPGFPKEK